MKTLRLSFASPLLLAACALPRAAQPGGFTLGQVLSSPSLLHRQRLRAYGAAADFLGRYLKGQKR